MSKSHEPRSCESSRCACQGGMNRRDFVGILGLGAAAALSDGLPVMAGPFEAADFEKLVPADKRLSPEWVKSLFARGSRTVYRGAELEKIGMPIGGICTGQIYLGGDGTLWHWDIFNQHQRTGAAHYAQPPQPEFPIDQGCAIRITSAGKTTVRALDHTGFSEISFTGEYPIGYVEYRDPQSPVNVSLEAFSPFIPLCPDDSHLPATVLNYTVKNTSAAKVDCQLAGWLQNGACIISGHAGDGSRVNKTLREPGLTMLSCAAAPAAAPSAPPREPIVFADFEGKDYGAWKVEGQAFGKRPAHGAPNSVQRLSGFQGKGLANSWTGSDKPHGKLISPEFAIERPYINFLIGGGQHPGQTCINLLVGGKVVRTATGKNSDAMEWANWDVGDLAGKTAHIEIIDAHSGGWGHIDIDQIEFGDRPRRAVTAMQDQADFGSMALALLDGKDDDLVTPMLPDVPLPGGLFSEGGLPAGADGTRPFPAKAVGALGRNLSLEPGQQATVTFVVAWYFPNILHLKLPGIEGRRYGKRFASAAEVARYIARDFVKLSAQTRLWHDTWYDSTLPYWFLDRTFLNTSILATSTAFWFGNNRFYGWEGVGCCPGTCAHVWHYAHAVARLFPQLERSAREVVDYGIAFDPATGSIGFRGEFHKNPAIDGQAGCILRAYREHQMSADDAFLRREWSKIRKSLEFLMAEDGNSDGVLEGRQRNTLDADWFGPVAWLSGLYLAALRAGQEMAQEMGDAAFAQRARATFDVGTRKLPELLFNGEYFVNRPDPNHAEAINSGTGCEIDQVFGQSWAFQVGLGRVLPDGPTRTALRSLWKYNFTPDVGPYRNAYKPGRWYAMPGEAGLLMCTFPRPDWSFEKARGSGKQGIFAGYFNECMTGFEYQVAGHMIWEGMVQEGLAITRAIHDRYHASRRNPWNEVECGDHYARAMASYGVFLAACGYEYHGPKGHLAFAPRLTPEDFRAPFTTAEGWGTFSQRRDGPTQHEKIDVKWGRLRIRTLACKMAKDANPSKVTVTLGGKAVDCRHIMDGGRICLTLAADALVEPGQALEIEIG
jgi:non-lysosomal glucosylceramidase